MGAGQGREGHGRWDGIQKHREVGGGEADVAGEVFTPYVEDVVPLLGIEDVGDGAQAEGANLPPGSRIQGGGPFVDENLWGVPAGDHRDLDSLIIGGGGGVQGSTGRHGGSRVDGKRGGGHRLGV